MYSNGTSDLSLHFTSRDFDYALPDGAFLRVTRVNGVEGNFSQGSITQLSRSRTWNSEFSAAISFDRAFEKSEYMTVAICYADGSELSQLKLKLSRFTSADDTWPTPVSTPPVPTIPPVQPTPSPTPRGPLDPSTTEPPHDTAIGWEPFELQEYLEGLTISDAWLRLYQEGFSVLTVQFSYEGDIPEGSTMALFRISGVEDDYGRGLITRNDDGSCTAQIFCNRHFPFLSNIAVKVCNREGEQLFRALLSVKRNHYPQESWPEVDKITNYPYTGQPAHTSTPVPPGYGYDHWNGFGPSPTPWYPTLDTWDDWVNDYNSGTSWIEEGMQIQTPNTGGYWGW